jgi:hypothetical protein
MWILVWTVFINGSVSTNSAEFSTFENAEKAYTELNKLHDLDTNIVIHIFEK